MRNKRYLKAVIFMRRHSQALLTWLIIFLAIAIGLYFHIDKEAIAVLVILFGILGNVFAGLAATIGMVPIIGPLVIKVLSLPFFWLLNALGYYVSVIAIRRGFKRDVLNYRVITMIFLIGFAVGFVIAKLL